MQEREIENDERRYLFLFYTRSIFYIHFYIFYFSPCQLVKLTTFFYLLLSSYAHMILSCVKKYIFYMCPYFFILNSLSLSLFFCRLLYSFVNFFSISFLFFFYSYILYDTSIMYDIFSYLYFKKFNFFQLYI